MDSAAAAAAAKRVQIEKAHNFMRQYRDPESRELKKLSANQFMDVWAHYDKDGAYIKNSLFIQLPRLPRLYLFYRQRLY